jgi:uncharacterized protein (TIGR00251 family)
MKDQKAIQQKENKLYIRVHVTPNASTSLFPAGFDTWRNSIEIYVQAEAQDNKANQDVIRVIAQYCQVPASQVRIHLGLKKRMKVIVITHPEIEQIRWKIEDAINGLSKNT